MSQSSLCSSPITQVVPCRPGPSHSGDTKCKDPPPVIIAPHMLPPWVGAGLTRLLGTAPAGAGTPTWPGVCGACVRPSGFALTAHPAVCVFQTWHSFLKGPFSFVGWKCDKNKPVRFQARRPTEDVAGWGASLRSSSVASPRAAPEGQAAGHSRTDRRVGALGDAIVTPRRKHGDRWCGQDRGPTHTPC